MCYTCFEGLGEEEVAKQFKNSLEEPKYDKWNKVSLNFIWMGCIGMAGVGEPQENAFKLADGYCGWSYQNYGEEWFWDNKIIQIKGFSDQYGARFQRKMLEKLRNYHNVEGSSHDDVMKDLTKMMNIVESSESEKYSCVVL
jgi:hypothetical protein